MSAIAARMSAEALSKWARPAGPGSNRYLVSSDSSTATAVAAAAKWSDMVLDAIARSVTCRVDTADHMERTPTAINTANRPADEARASPRLAQSARAVLRVQFRAERRRELVGVRAFI